MQIIEEKKRIEWVDIAKTLGIFAIYLGHLGEVSGLAFKFVFAFHVPLFFFLSGCMSNYDSETNVLKFIVKKIKTILLPFYLFSLFTMLLWVIINNWGHLAIIDSFTEIIKGCIRNGSFGSLWFLSCLFVMEIVFKVIKLAKKKWLILLISLALFMTSNLLISPRPFEKPHWIYNADSALYYIIFYALGYCLYPYILKLFELNSRAKKIGFGLILLATGAYAGMLFIAIPMLGSFEGNEFIVYAIEIIQPLILIAFILCISKLLEGIVFLQKVGQQTLYLCGNEIIVKECITAIFSVIGLSPIINNPLKVYFYTGLLIAFNYFAIIPIEKRVVKAIKKNSGT